jgi:hypothetical protein
MMTAVSNQPHKPIVGLNQDSPPAHAAVIDQALSTESNKRDHAIKGMITAVRCAAPHSGNR